jgi:hypothetical protein
VKKEYLFFLVLVLAAAVITGTTIGLIKSMPIIEKQVLTGSNQDSVLIRDNNNQLAVPQKNSHPIIKENSTALTVPHNLPVIKEHLILSKEENKQISDMLTSLGAHENDDYSKFLSNFQRVQGLMPTGNLDSSTLDAIIIEVKKQRVWQMANR